MIDGQRYSRIIIKYRDRGSPSCHILYLFRYYTQTISRVVQVHERERDLQQYGLGIASKQNRRRRLEWQEPSSLYITLHACFLKASLYICWRRVFLCVHFAQDSILFRLLFFVEFLKRYKPI